MKEVSNTHQGSSNVKIDIKIEEPSESNTPAKTPPDSSSIDGYDVTLQDDVIKALSKFDEANNDTFSIPSEDGGSSLDDKDTNASNESNTELGDAQKTDENEAGQTEERKEQTQKGYRGEVVTIQSGEVMSVKPAEEGIKDLCSCLSVETIRSIKTLNFV